MKHSNFEVIRRYMRETEERELIEALKAHKNSYTFITNEGIEDDEDWMENVPNIDTWYLDDEDTVEVLVMRAELIGEHIMLHGETRRSRIPVEFPLYSTPDGSAHCLMDFMREPQQQKHTKKIVIPKIIT